MMYPTIGISDPLPVFRSGLRSELTRASFTVDEPTNVVEWLGARRDMTESETSRAVLLSLATKADWVVLDRLHDRRPEVVVVTLLHEPSEQAYCSALARGAISAAPRAAPCSQIVEVVRAALSRHALLPAAISTALALGRTHRSGDVLDEDERRWLRDLADGASVTDLAWRFGYSRRTMYRRLTSVYRRLGASRREGALIAAVRDGLI